MSNEQDQALIARSRKERKNNINKLFGSLQKAKNTITIAQGIPKSERLWLVLEHLGDIDQALTLLLGAGWMNGETNQGENEAKKSGAVDEVSL